MIIGKIESIHITKEHAEPTISLDSVHVVPGMGLSGDRHFTEHDPENERQITFIEKESIEALSTDYRVELPSGDTRRNVVTSGIPLNHLVGKQFQIGTLKFKGTKLCEPCSHLASLTEPKVLPGLIHRGGLCAQILSEGTIRTGDQIKFE